MTGRYYEQIGLDSMTAVVGWPLSKTSSMTARRPRGEHLYFPLVAAPPCTLPIAAVAQGHVYINVRSPHECNERRCEVAHPPVTRLNDQAQLAQRGPFRLLEQEVKITDRHVLEHAVSSCLGDDPDLARLPGEHPQADADLALALRPGESGRGHPTLEFGSFPSEIRQKAVARTRSALRPQPRHMSVVPHEHSFAC